MGLDHLIFVSGLLFLIKSRAKIFLTITAFTVAHSITLAIYILGKIQVDATLIELMVAVSIAVVGVELVYAQRGMPGITSQVPALIAFSFGLLHGFAFAGALMDIGLPTQGVLLPLLLFNLGVEAGQILFVSALFALHWFIRRHLRHMPSWIRVAPAYAIGSLGIFLFLQRFSEYA